MIPYDVCIEKYINTLKEARSCDKNKYLKKIYNKRKMTAVFVVVKTQVS